MSPDEPQHPAGGTPPPEPTDTSLEPGMPTPGPAWHRQSVLPDAAAAAEGEAVATSGGDDVSPPPAPPDASPPPPGEAPPGEPPRSGGHLAAGVFLFLGGSSVLAGLLGLLGSGDVGFPANSIACGIAFVALFLIAVGLRGNRRLDPLRSTLGVVAVFFLVACFTFAVQTGSDGFGDQAVRVKAAGAGAVATVGMLLAAVLVPSAVAAGFAVAALGSTVLLSMLAAGVTSPGQLGVAAVITNAVVLVAAGRLPLLRPHRRGLAWMLGVAALLAGIDALGPAAGFSGAGIAAAGVLGVALAVIAWRHALVVPAIAAVPALGAVEAYLVTQLTGPGNLSGSNATSVAVLVIGVLTLLSVGFMALVVRGRAPSPGAGRAVRVEELLLVAAVVLALISLGEGGSAFTPPFGSFAPSSAAPQ